LTFKALDIVDLVPDDYNEDLWPTWNVDNIKAIPSQNLYNNQLFISDEGVLLKFTI